MTSAQPTYGQNYEMDAIGSCFIGGASAYGGTGTVPGVIVGAVLMGVINLGMSLMGVDQNMQKVVKQYEKDNDLVLQYLEEKCQKQDDVKTRAKTLYDNYKLWCKSNGYYVCSMKKFNAELMAHPEWYEQKSVSGGVAVYYGIMMKTTG